MRTTKPEQLNLVFADRPQGGQAAAVPALLGAAKGRRQKAKAKDLIEELQEQVKQLTIENQALSVSRDTFQAENAQH